MATPEFLSRKQWFDPFAQPLESAAIAATALESELPAQDSSLLRAVSHFGLHYAIIRGVLDTENIRCPTPDCAVSAFITDSNGAVANMLGLTVAANLNPISYVAENSGAIATHLTPHKPTADDKADFEKSTGALRGHTDGCYNPSPPEFKAGDTIISPAPDYVLLGCIRNPNRVATRLARLDRILAHMPANLIAELQKAVFVLRPQRSWLLDDLPERFGPMLWFHHGHLCCRFSHRHLSVEQLANPVAATALTEFKQALPKVYEDVCLEPGDVLILNNRTVIHGRNSVGQEWSKDARWLIRSYAMMNGTPMRTVEGSEWLAQ